jgi:hypothetical protein
MDAIRFIVIVFLSSLVAIAFTFFTGVWPGGIIIFFCLIGAGLYVHEYVAKRIETIKSSRLLKQETRYEVVEYSDNSNIPVADFPSKEELDRSEAYSGKGQKTHEHADPGLGWKAKKRPVEQFMEMLDIDRRRASILYNSGYVSIEDLRHATVEDLAGLEGLSPTVARKIVARLKGGEPEKK